MENLRHEVPRYGSVVTLEKIDRGITCNGNKPCQERTFLRMILLEGIQRTQKNVLSEIGCILFTPKVYSSGFSFLFEPLVSCNGFVRKQQSAPLTASDHDSNGV